MQSTLYSITWRDAFHAVLTSLATAFFSALSLVVNNKITSQNYIFTLADLKLVLAIALLTFLGNMSKRFLTDQNGQFVGRY